jgi:hypothetical protein
MTPLATRLAAITARCAAATERPWKVMPGDEEWFVVFPDGEDASVLTEPTATFIAHARTDLPLLVQALTRAVEALEAIAEAEAATSRPVYVSHVADVLAALDRLAEEEKG